MHICKYGHEWKYQWGPAFRVHVRVLCIYPIGKCDLVWPKSQENQDNDDSACQGSFNSILGWWSHDQLPKIAKKKKKLQPFLNQFELCSKVLPLWRYKVNNFLVSHFVQLFSIFPHENDTKQDDFNTVQNVREGATIIVSWEIWPKKGSAYLERDNDTDRLRMSDYIHTFEFTGTYTCPLCHNPVDGCIPAGIVSHGFAHPDVTHLHL